MPLAEAFAIGVLPFLIVDAVKVGIAATVARSLAPGRSRIA
jgi:biotin transporter BioY